MEALEELALVFNQLLKNNPFKKEEQIDLFTKLATEHFESIHMYDTPSDDFEIWWKKIGKNKAKLKCKGIINAKTNKDEYDDFLMSEQVDEWYSYTWLTDTVLSNIPNE